MVTGEDFTFGRGRGGNAPERGRQFTSAESPDKKWRAVYKDADRNVYLVDAANVETAITTDGSKDKRIKNGTASWVYGEELAQRTAMWWSPDSRRIAYYRFDEKGVPDYYLQLEQTKLQSAVDAGTTLIAWMEAYRGEVFAARYRDRAEEVLVV